MKRFGTTVLFLASLGLLAVAMTPWVSHRAVASESAALAYPPTPVKVVNTPLPVQGSLSVANTVSVNVANTPIPITNAPNAANNPTPLVVVPTVTQPYQDTCSGLGKNCNFQTIPTGMRLVIQEVDFQGSVLVGTSDVVITTTVNGTAISHFFTVTNAANYAVANQPTTLYADSATTPQCSPNSVFVGSFTCAFSGYLVSAQ